MGDDRKSTLTGVAGVVLASLFLFLALVPRQAVAGEATLPVAVAGEATLPVKVKVGLFVTQLADFDMAKRSYFATFWTWFIHDSPTYDPRSTVEIVNAKSDNVKYAGLDTSRGVRWYQQKHSSVLSENWDVTYFPFDRQTLHILIEDGDQDANNLLFVADETNSAIDPSVDVPGWTLEGFHVASKEITYATNYGDPALKSASRYSQAQATITLKRNGVRLMCSLFVGFGVAFLLAMLSFCLDCGEMAGTRIGLCAAAVFAAVGNKYALDNFLPASSGFTLSDLIVASSFASIILAALSVVLLRWMRPRRPVAAHLLNVFMAIATLVGVVGVNTVVIIRAVA